MTPEQKALLEEWVSPLVEVGVLLRKDLDEAKSRIETLKNLLRETYGHVDRDTGRELGTRIDEALK